MKKPDTVHRLILAAVGPSVLNRVSKANGLCNGQLRALLGVVALRELGVRASPTVVAGAAMLGPRTGRVYTKDLVRLGLLDHAKVSGGKFNRSALVLTDAGEVVARRYDEALRAASRRFRGLD